MTDNKPLDISVIIVSYNIKYFLEQCLYSLQRALSALNAEVFIVDNNSSDNSVEYLAQRFPSYNFICNSSNVGFGRACNQPLPQCRGRYILYLNPDTIVAEDSITTCTSFLDAHADAGALGCRMIDGSGNFLPESKRSFPSVAVSFYKLSGLSKLFPRSSVFNKYALGYLPEKEIHSVDVLCGAFMMTRANLLKKLGGFDEDFFMYGEDVDLSYRITREGFKNYYFPHTTIVHFKGESSQQDKSKHLHAFYNAMKIFVHKHYKGNYAGLLSATLTGAIWLRAFASLLAIPFKHMSTRAGTFVNNKLVLIGSPSTTSNIVPMLKDRGAVEAMEPGQEQLQNNSLTEYIFCINGFSYRDAIGLLSTILKNCSCKWHYPASGSVVGSTDKDARGEVYVL